MQIWVGGLPAVPREPTPGSRAAQVPPRPAPFPAPRRGSPASGRPLVAKGALRHPSLERKGTGLAKRPKKAETLVALAAPLITPGDSHSAPRTSQSSKDVGKGELPRGCKFVIGRKEVPPPETQGG